ncbi:hypothetical protein PtA15_7A352 [Puccinia triticina]|uniref:Uncharacterized protein n=1 Tax=Puccinia triticina TaxID=208348 RepID=A0ABY7CPM2_9BASI|nr:uncharacterized protein PtA15_7A352 [Puccinia triticina]WAQ86625.1 hypothetical protein PtA15_7A352 [Puccinia triticina]WAR56485.1 hypothetical protein PtB15_7B334 [Puccinia triticina]
MLILAAQNLTTLDLADLDPELVPRFVSLATALKSSIKVLQVSGISSDNGQTLKPLFEVLRETIEGISVQSNSVIGQVLNLEFPKLRVFETQSSHLLTNLLTEGIFLHSIEVLGIDICSVDYDHLLACKARGIGCIKFTMGRGISEMMSL